jgi:hypothetical protein
MEGLQQDTGRDVEESAELDRVVGLVMSAIEADVREIARALVSRGDDELLGPGEFDLRDRVLKAASHILEATLNDRKKGGTEAAARVVLAVAATRGSSRGGRRAS